MWIAHKLAKINHAHCNFSCSIVTAEKKKTFFLPQQRYDLVGTWLRIMHFMNWNSNALAVRVYRISEYMKDSFFHNLQLCLHLNVQLDCKLCWNECRKCRERDETKHNKTKKKTKLRWINRKGFVRKMGLLRRKSILLTFFYHFVQKKERIFVYGWIGKGVFLPDKDSNNISLCCLGNVSVFCANKPIHIVKNEHFFH